MKDKLILLERRHPTLWEIHRYEISQTKNIILTTSDKEFAQKLVKSYNRKLTLHSQKEFDLLVKINESLLKQLNKK